MKRIIVSLCFIMSACMPIYQGMAEIELSETLKKIPALKQGLSYSIADSEFSYLSTVELASWKGFTAEAGYSSSDKLVGVISYPILKLKDFGITLPILDLLEANIGLYAGFGRIALHDTGGNNEFDYGASLTLIRVKW